VVTQSTRTRAPSPWLTIHEASALIGVSTATLRRWCDAGDVKAFTTPGGHRRFSRSAVLGILPSGRRTRRRLRAMGETPERIVARVYRPHVRDVTNGVGWREPLADADREPLRELGRRAATELLVYLDAATPEAAEEALVAAEVAAVEHAAIAAEHGLTVAEAVDGFLRFRLLFLRELGSLARRRGLDATEATDLIEAANEATDRLLRAFIRASEGTERSAATGCACASAPAPGAAPA
jgi:excisionase family DNA binding protein